MNRPTFKGTACGAVAWLFFCAILLPGSVAAAPATPSYDAGSAVQEARPPQQSPVEKPQEVPEIPELKVEPFTLPDGETIFIRDFRFAGVAETELAAVRELVAPYRDRELTLSEIYAAAGKITAYYRNKGFLVARAYVPKQDASAGVLLIQMVVGRYGKITLQNNSRSRDQVIAGIFDNAMPAGEPVARDDLERAMLLTSDLPGVGMPKIAISRGEQAGTTDFAVAVDPTSRVEGYLLADNYGSRYTGKERLSAGLQANELLGIGDQLALNGRTSKASGLQNGQLDYLFPLGYRGLRLDLGIGRTTYELGSLYRDLDAKGTADTFRVGLSYPWQRSSSETLTLSFDIAARRLRDEMLGEVISKKHSYVATLGVSRLKYGTLFGLRSVSSLTGGFSYGDLSFPDDDQEAANKAGADTAGRFAKLTLGFREQLQLSQKLTLSARLQGQKALGNKNLDGSEQFTLSGPEGVRSYYTGLMGDTGYLAVAEVKYALPPVLQVNNSVGLFTDFGRTYLEDGDFTDSPHSYRLSDVGVAYYVNYEYSQGRYLIGTLQAVWAYGPDQDTGNDDSNSRILGQVGITF
ncbi:ShlB/FhaC/HecB family hemolysin secretion/activation protein [Pelobacter seleniigenes]|uniref:ShlB/FhaC/HecB family hemolysin secretion/activation protein n=1 Tax=Pelobacter seleniigenes TaxID=407188 RepID=UPI0004A6F9E6|nr:ShlB/FhaC/HecB family hemolysin secretion/activation protein [Pelobacter seleniigenes]